MGVPTKSGTGAPPNVAPPPVPPQRGMSNGAKGAIVAVVVIVVVLLAVLLSGVIPGFKLSSTSPGGSSGPSYNVTFSESGLTGGTMWSVTLGGSTLSSTTTTIVFSEQNGTYSFTVGSVTGYSPSPASGSVTVNGKVASQGITFKGLLAGQYSVTFTESGLTAGTSWSVTLKGSMESSAGTSIVYTEANGTYAFTVGSVSGYNAPSPASGNAVVSGMDATQTVAFTASGGGGGGGQESYSTASPVATTAAGAGWVAVFAYGVDYTTPYTNTTTRGNASCPVTGGSSTWPTIPAYTGDYHNGLLTAWVFLFYESSTTSEEAIYVSGTSATVLGQITGASCIGDTGTLAGLGAGIVDSTTVATTIAANSTIAGFISTNATASAYYFLLSGNAADNAFWVATYSTCVPGVSGPGYESEALVNASSGVLTFAYASATACGTTPFTPAGGHAAVVSGFSVPIMRGLVRLD